MVDDYKLPNDEDGQLTKNHIKTYGRSPLSDPKATGYESNGDPTYRQILNQTAEEVDKVLNDLDN